MNKVTPFMQRLGINRHYSTVTPKFLSIGIRREDKNRWERRVPLLPDEVERLTQEFAATVYIQPSTKRVIPDSKYQEAGAIVTDDLSRADIIIGVKEVPIHKLMPGKTHMFFSHTHKGQPYNMGLLKEVVDKKIRLIDYELLVNENKKRLVLFSKFAGYAGHRLLGMGYGTPFLSIGMSYMYRCLADARLDVTRTGQVIMDDGLPPQLGPMTFVFTGAQGNVTKGALHVFKCLPHEWVSPNELQDLFKSKSASSHKVYGCLVNSEDYIIRKDGKPFEKSFYKSNPDQHESIFHEKIAPYTRFLSNGIFWDEKYPRLLTIEQSRKLFAEDRLPLLTLADISCDINGSLEFMSHATAIDDPLFMYDPILNENHINMEGRGIQVMSIDNLPTEMPLEASEYFSSSLFPFVVQLIKGNFEHPVIKGATIAYDGQLAPKHQHLQQSITKYANPNLNNYGSELTVSKPSSVLVLGSGFVAQPLVDYLVETQFSVTIASDSVSDAVKIAGKRPKVSTVALDVSDGLVLNDLISQHDVVVSLVPASLHPMVAKAAIANKKHMVTASYISAEMAQLDASAKAAGVTILNELGLDPGIDHMTAMKMFDELKNENCKLTGFTSWCGGLPAPEASDNPLGYKFSWSPKGVLLAALNSATYKKNGKISSVPGDELLESAVDVDICKGLSLEGLPNRDSVKYQQVYGLDDSVQTVYRGTLRYKGYSRLMSAMKDLGLLSNASVPENSSTWNECIMRLLQVNQPQKIKPALKRQLGADRGQLAWECLQWLGCLSDTRINHNRSLIDEFCRVLQDKLAFKADERDMVCMQHEFTFVNAKNQQELIKSTLITYGDVNKYSAMAKTVGLPAAIGTRLLLEGKITEKGVIAPISKEIYNPIILELETRGISFKETRTLLY